jgi:Porin PorA
MRRVVGLTLTGLGAFFFALALLLKFYVPGQVIKFPLNEYAVSTLAGGNMTYFSQHDLTDLAGVTMHATTTVEGDVAAGTSSTAVWQEFVALQDVSNNTPVSYTSQRLAFDRRTGVLVNCCGDRIGSNTKVHLSGQGYVWPFNTQKRTYQVFDTTLLKPEPFRYEGSVTVDGITAYKFVEQVSNQQFGTQSLPGSLVGIKNQASVTLPEYLTATNTFLVDPVTGATLSATEKQAVSLKDSAGATRLVLLAGTLSSPPDAVQSLVNTSNSYHLKIQFVHVIGPLVGLLLGIVLLALGMTLLLKEPDDEELIYQDDESEPVTA